MIIFFIFLILFQINIYSQNLIFKHNEVNIKLHVLNKQFNEAESDETKIDALTNAAKYGLKSYPVFKKAVNDSNPMIRQIAIIIMAKKNLKFSDLIFNKIFDSDTNVVKESLKAFYLLNEIQKDKLIKFLFKINKDEFYISGLNALFSNPKKYNNYIKKLLFIANHKVKYETYKFIFLLAPKYENLAVLALFDENIDIQRLLLKNIYKYKKKFKRKVLLYALNSKYSLIREFAQTILMKN